MLDHKICIPRGTHERLLQIAVVHQLTELPIGNGGPNTYHFSRERLHKAIALLEPLSSIEGIQALIKELQYYDQQSRPPEDRLFAD